MRQITTRHLLVIMVVFWFTSLCLYGCMSSQDITTQQLLPTSTTIPGWSKFTGNGFELQLPNTFIGGNPRQDVDVIVSGLKSKGTYYTDMKEYIEKLPAAEFIAFDTSITSASYITMVLVGKIAIDRSAQVESFLNQYVSKLPVEYKIIEQGIINFGAYKAGNVIGEVNTTEGVHLAQENYFIKAQDIMWQIVCTMPYDELAQRRKIFDQSVRTFLAQDNGTGSTNNYLYLWWWTLGFVVIAIVLLWFTRWWKRNRQVVIRNLLDQ